MQDKKINKETIVPDAHLENAYHFIAWIDEKEMDFLLLPDDADLEQTIALANKVLDNFPTYEKNARQRIIEDNLPLYNENCRMDNEPAITETAFSNNLTLQTISITSHFLVEFYYHENGMFGDHSLIAQAFDGEHFDESTVFG